MVWTLVAQKDYWNAIVYIAEHWSNAIVEKFKRQLGEKMAILSDNPELGFKSTRYSKFRKTVVSKHYIVIYSVFVDQIVVHRLKHINTK